MSLTTEQQSLSLEIEIFLQVIIISTTLSLSIATFIQLAPCTRLITVIPKYSVQILRPQNTVESNNLSHSGEAMSGKLLRDP